MSILLTRGGNAALLPYLPRLASVRRNLTTVPVSAAAPPQDRRHRLDMCRGRLTPERYCVQGNGDEWNESVVVVMGATGTGKSKLSIDLATMFAGEVVNSDKIQVYRGLDITTNKMPVPERCGVPHHILGELDPAVGELRPEAFREMAARAIAGIAGRGLLPVLAGGSNSFIHAAMTGRYDPVRSPFEAGWRLLTRREARALRYRCCFLSVDVNAAVLAEQLDRRVEEMVAAGMVEELGRYFAAEAEAEAEAEAGESRHPGLGKAIGVAEFREYFRGEGRGTAAAYEDAVAAIKANTRRLAEEQVRKIERLVEMGWPLRRVDATAAVAARLAGEAAKAEAAWERDVAGPGATAVEQFLSEEVHVHHHHNIVSPPLLYT